MGTPSHDRTVFNYETREAYCPVCHQAIQPGWHVHHRRSFGLVTRNWWYRTMGGQVNVRAWKVGTWLGYHLWVSHT
jgi:hypothetical protein